MSEDIAIICTVAELPDYGAPNDTVRVFTANFSVAMTGAAPPSPLAQVFLQPWLWKLDPTITLYVQPLGNPKSGRPLTANILPVPDMVAAPNPVPPPNPPALPDAFKLLGNGLSALFTDTLAHSDPQAAPLFAWTPSSPGTPPAQPVRDPVTHRIYQPWTHVLAHASTYGAPLSQRLNLVVFFSMPKVDLVGFDTLFVAPTFQVSTTAGGVTTTVTVPAPAMTSIPTPTAVTTAPGPNDPQPGVFWLYPPVINAPPTVTLKAHQSGLSITPAAAPVAVPGQPPAPGAPAVGTLDPASLWITPLAEDCNEDWRTTLETRASETFDLGRQVITALQGIGTVGFFGPDPPQDPKQSNADYATQVAALRLQQCVPLDQLRNLVVALLRDTIDMGLRYAPDGLRLLEYVLQRISPTLVPSSTLDSFAAALVADDALYAPSQQTSPARWLTQLTQILTSSIPALQTIIRPPQGQSPPPGVVLFTNPNYDSVVRALSDLQKLLAQDATIATIVFSEWNRILGQPATQAAWTGLLGVSSLSSQVQAQLNTLANAGTLRKRVLMANLGGKDTNLATWMRIIQIDTKKGSERQQVRDNLNAALMSYFDSRFGALQPGDVDDAGKRTPLLPQFLQGLPAKTVAQLQARVQIAAKAAGDILSSTSDELKPGDPPPQPDPSGTAHPAVLRVSATAPATAASGDPLRDIAGVGMLLRQFNPSAATQLPWSCLTTATLKVKFNGQEQTAASIGFIPHRLIVRNGLLQAAISYKSRPLSSASPDDHLGDDLAQSNDLAQSGVSKEDYDSLIETAYSPDTTLLTDATKLDAWAHIPGLKYGAFYQALAFKIRNSGALPRELTRVAGVGAPGSPPNLPAPIQPLPPGQCQLPEDKAVTFQYKRRTPVGHIRFVMNGGEQDFTQNSLPVIPSTVAPLAREVDPDAVPPVPNSSTSAVPATPDELLQGVRSSVPLLLQWGTPAAATSADNTTYQYIFKVRPPAASFHVWNRWVSLPKAGDPDLTWTRAAVYADTTFSAPKDVTQGQPNTTLVSDTSPNGVDLSINDATVEALCFTLIPLYSPSQNVLPAPKPGDPVPNAIYVPMSKLTPVAGDSNFAQGSGIIQVQGNYITVTVRSGQLPTTAPPITLNGTNVTVNVPAGEVWKLSIAAAIDPTQESRFDENAIGNQFAGRPQIYSNGANPVQTMTFIAGNTPLEMLIEHAQPCQLTSKDLWRGLQVIPPSIDPNKGMVVSTALTVTLAPVSQPVAPQPALTTVGWHLVRRITVQRQAWRWMGRPPLPAPFDGPPAPVLPADINGIIKVNVAPPEDLWGPSDAMNTALDWESHQFAERTDSPTSTDSSVFFQPSIKADGSVSQTVYCQDLSGDLRAQYFRFSALLYSRYEGLPGFQSFSSGQDQAIASQIVFNSTDGTVDGYTPWVRGFVPCRIPLPPPAAFVDPSSPPTTLPTPKILICLPLTAPIEPPETLADPQSMEKHGHTSLLVIADEPWYQVVGLAEQLEAVIEEVSISPGVLPPQNPPALDPGVTALQIGPDPIIFTSAFPAGVNQPAQWLGRPVGTTFDEASTTPLLANTAMQFKMPTVAGLSQLDWYLAKVKFRRSARNTMLLGAGPKDDGAPPKLVSAYTDGTWVQFLPSSDHIATMDNKSVFVGDLTFAFDANNNYTLTFTNTPGDAQSATPVALRSGPTDAAAAKAKFELWALLMQNITDAGGIPGELYVDLCRLDPAQPHVVQNHDSVSHLYLIEVQRNAAPPPPALQPPGGTWLNDLYPGSSIYPNPPAPQIARTGDPDKMADVLYRVVRMSARVQRSATG
jgi:hypothetical protein